MKLKRYLAFFGDQYYPLGGMEDLLGSSDTLGSAVEQLNSKCNALQRPRTCVWVNRVACCTRIKKLCLR